MIAGLFLLGAAAAAAWDLRCRRVPNLLNLVYGLTGIAASAYTLGQAGVVQAMLGIFVGFTAMLIPFSLRLYLGGDVKFIMALGSWLGPLKILKVVAYGSVLGGILAGLFILSEKCRVRSETEQADQTGSRGHRGVPMAMPFALGAVLAFFELGY